MLYNQDIMFAKKIVEKMINGKKIVNLLKNKISTELFIEIIEMLKNSKIFDFIDVFKALIKFDTGYDFKTIYNALELDGTKVIKTFIISCRYNNIFYPKWILHNYINTYYSGNIFDIIKVLKYDIIDGFEQSCLYGNIEIAKWLLEMKDKNGNIFIDIYNEYYINIFKKVCINNRLDIACWLYKKNPLHFNKNDEFIKECIENCDIDMSRWIRMILE